MRFLVLGSINIDMTFKVDHIVRGGETLSSDGLSVNAGGKGANQAAALGKAGMEVYFAGKMGTDGEWILDMLRSFGVDTSLSISSDDIHTGQALIQVDKAGQNCILLNAGGNKEFTRSDIDKILGHFSKGDTIILQNEINEVAYAMERASAAGLAVILNPSPFDSAKSTLPLQLADTLFVNEVESASLAGVPVPADDEGFRTVMDILGNMYSDTRIILTAGKNGAYCFEKNRKVSFAPIVDYPVVDTTGAGDTFCGYFLAAEAAGKDAEEALCIASKAAGIAVSRSGAMQAMPWAGEVSGE